MGQEQDGKRRKVHVCFSEKTGIKMRKKRIMIVDDEPDFVEMIRLRLEANGYEVITANNGQQALEKGKENPHLILLDVMMPEMDGYTLLRRLKKMTPQNQYRSSFLPQNLIWKRFFGWKGSAIIS